MKAIIRNHMTTSPVTIGRAQTLHAAHRLMTEHRIRHLPVLEDGSLVGVLSMREVQLVQALDDVDPNLVLVDTVMRPNPFTVSPDTTIAATAREMAQRKLGSVVVVDGPEVVGVFTTIDALRALAEEAGQADVPHP